MYKFYRKTAPKERQKEDKGGLRSHVSGFKLKTGKAYPLFLFLPGTGNRFLSFA
jgi:hypothetical protein